MSSIPSTPQLDCQSHQGVVPIRPVVRVRTFDQEARPQTIAELRIVMSFRKENFASFWLSAGEGPSLAVLVKDDIACVHYFPSKEHPGFHSVGLKADWETMVSFVADNYEAIDVPLAMVVPWNAALLAAEEFFQSSVTPTSIKWSEL